MFDFFTYSFLIDALSVFILFSAIHGIFLSFQILSKSKSKKSNFLFAIILFIISIHLIEILIGLRGYTYLLPHIDGITFPLIFTIGPLYYFYVRFITDPKFKLQGYHVAHFLPAIIIFYQLLPYYFLNSESKAQSLKQIAEMLASAEIVTLSNDLIIQLIFHSLQLTAYLAASFIYVKRFKEKTKEETAQTDAIEKIDWLGRTTFAFGCYTGFYFLMLMSLLNFGSYYLVIDTVWLFIVSLFIHLAGYAVIRQPILEVNNIINYEPEPSSTDKKYVSSSLSEIELDEIHSALINYMKDHKPYLNDKLRLSDVAEKINTSSYNLSRVINEKEGLNFYEFVNRYRIQESIELMNSDTKQSKKILAIAFEAGFNNKVSFNRSFKKITGKTPSQFRDHIQN